MQIISSKMLLGYTDTVLDRRYTIGIQCFSTDMLWDQGLGKWQITPSFAKFLHRFSHISKFISINSEEIWYKFIYFRLIPQTTYLTNNSGANYLFNPCFKVPVTNCHYLLYGMAMVDKIPSTIYRIKQTLVEGISF